jgi:hypothetical protein
MPIRGIIDRRILVNFRVDRDVLARILPAPFRPQRVRGAGMAGVCLIRLKDLRPRLVPPFLGISSENAAHRIAVAWDQGGSTREGIFIPRWKTSSRLNTVAGGQLFPGVHHHAAFQVQEHDGRYRVEMYSDDRGTRLLVEGRVVPELAPTSIFGSLQEASDFFEKRSLGYSVTAKPGQFDGLELRSYHWQMQPLAVYRVESSVFANRAWFPPGSVAFDCALFMRGIDHKWHGRGRFCAGCNQHPVTATACTARPCP